MKKISRFALFMAISILLFIIICTTLFNYLENGDIFLGIAVLGSGVLIFFTCIILSQESGVVWMSDPGHVRATIAISIIVEYMVLVGLVAFLSSGPDSKDIPQLTQTLITNFTSIVGVVVAFYFGSSAYLQSRERRNRRDNNRQQDNAPSPS